MIPIYLMFANETEALAALTKDDAPIWPASALQWVPVPVTRVTGELDAEGFEIFETAPGYHVNALWDAIMTEKHLHRHDIVDGLVVTVCCPIERKVINVRTNRPSTSKIGRQRGGNVPSHPPPGSACLHA